MALFIIIIVVVVISAAVGIPAERRKNEERKVVWTSAYQQLGMDPASYDSKGTMKLDGTVQGYRVIADRGVHKSNEWVDFKVVYPPLGLGLKLRNEGAFMATSKVIPFLGPAMTGGADIELGDQDFDTRFFVVGNDPAQVAEFLTETRRLMLVRLHQNFKGVKIDDASIAWRMRGPTSTPEHLTAPILHFISAAQLLGSSVPELDRAVETIAQGDLVDGMQQLERVQGAAATEARLLEAEIMASGASEASEVQRVLSDLDQRVPSDPELSVLHSHMDDAEKPPLAAPAYLDPLPEGTPHDGQQQLDQLTELFGASTYESRLLFDEHYRGHTITWMGTVRRVTPFSHDLDFGDGPGIKAMIGIGHVQSEYGRVEIDALVHLPADAQLTMGDEMKFTGTLVKMDGFTRNVFVADARISG